MASKLEQAQAKRMKQVRGRSPGRQLSGSETERRKKDPEYRERQKKTEVKANKKQAERYQKTASRAMKKDAAIRKTAKEAGEAAAKRAVKGMLGPLAGVAAATEMGAEAVKAVVEPKAEKAKAERKSYNKRASTDSSKAARGVREAMSGDRMSRLRAKEMSAGGQVRGAGMAKQGVRPCKMR